MKFVLRQKQADDRPCAIEALEGGRFQITVDGESFGVTARPLGGGGWSLLDDDGHAIEAWVHGGSTPAERVVALFDGTYRFSLLSPAAALHQGDPAAAGGAITSPMPGRLVKLWVAEGDAVKAGQPLCVVEAMKMQNEIAAPAGGVVKSIRYRAGEQVAAGAVLLLIG